MLPKYQQEIKWVKWYYSWVEHYGTDQANSSMLYSTSVSYLIDATDGSYLPNTENAVLHYHKARNSQGIVFLLLFLKKKSYLLLISVHNQ
jgi:hypothetical protein